MLHVVSKFRNLIHIKLGVSKAFPKSVLEQVIKEHFAERGTANKAPVAGGILVTLTGIVTASLSVSRTSGLPDFRTPGLSDSRTFGLQDFRTFGLQPPSRYLLTVPIAGLTPIELSAKHRLYPTPRKGLQRKADWD